MRATGSLNLLLHLLCLCPILSWGRSWDELPPLCLGQLARQQLLASQAKAQSRYCNPGRFVEIEFTLRFGCDVPTHIDQGVRFEIDIGTDWIPIRFYTPTLTPAPIVNNTRPAVQLEPGGNSVFAELRRFNSSFPLLYLNDSAGVEGGVVIRKYLCEEFVDHIMNRSFFRLRWLQRHFTNPRANVATWSLDDVKVRVWNKNCFQTLLNLDFNSPVLSVPFNITLRFQRGSVSNPPCLTNQNIFVAYFNGSFDPEFDIRRSLRINFDNYTLSSCEAPPTTCTDVGAGDLESNCPVTPSPPESITCSLGKVSCGCGQREREEGGVTCQGGEAREFTEAPPTDCPFTATTEAPPTTSMAAKCMLTPYICQ